MGTFSTKASNALEKVLKRRSLVEIKQTIDALTRSLDQVVVETARVEAEADRILDPKLYVDGSEIKAVGQLERNLTENLDGPSLTRAISTAVSVHDSVSAERARWVEEERARHAPARSHVATKFKEDHTHGPGTKSWLLGH